MVETRNPLSWVRKRVIASLSMECGITLMIQFPSESTGDFQAEWRLEVNSPTKIPIATAITPSAKACR